ncbi:MAG: DNA mismatch repair endonuclease MutH [Myxococcales bacterium]|nr:DNA mismatch repair endonuclease MutH [Myxococcales bacterium]
MRDHRPPPTDEAELLRRVAAIAGRTVAELAASVGVVPPENLSGHKGFLGDLLEACLGASAGSRDEPDFTELGIELKTLPIDARGRPRESTYVCRVVHDARDQQQWPQSRVWRKLARVLWIPVDGEPRLPLASRRIGCGLLWRLEGELEALVRADWEQHQELIRHGQIDAIRARDGRYLQVRPKAANSAARLESVDRHGVRIETLPRGYYLRTAFTRLVVERYHTL